MDTFTGSTGKHTYIQTDRQTENVNHNLVSTQNITSKIDVRYVSALKQNWKDLNTYTLDSKDAQLCLISTYLYESYGKTYS